MKTNPHNVYNHLAKDYDAIQRSDSGNGKIRDYVKTRTLHYAGKQSQVMDFGGGTGLDLHWLSQNCRQVFFCEPSEHMQQLALEKIKQQQLNNVMVVKEPDFETWEPGRTGPPETSMDLVLANFAVLNSIARIDLLFNRLASVMKKNGVLILSVLHGFPVDYSGFRIFKKPLNFFRFYAANDSFILENPGHNTIIHTHKKILSSASACFNCMTNEKIPGSMFSLYIFKKI